MPGRNQGVRCAQCGAGVSATAKFCAACGASTAPPPALICGACGAPLPSSARFCRRCGLKAGSTPAAEGIRATGAVARADSRGGGRGDHACRRRGSVLAVTWGRRR
ncbi:MAG: zinc ribbon domain-containing protein [Dehalococcoidia bacterium]|nr:zinc ribbon domain-containing protein [Dehalococcoidia bacterium]